MVIKSNSFTNQYVYFPCIFPRQNVKKSKLAVSETYYVSETYNMSLAVFGVWSNIPTINFILSPKFWFYQLQFHRFIYYHFVGIFSRFFCFKQTLLFEHSFKQTILFEHSFKQKYIYVCFKVYGVYRVFENINKCKL